jgi:hypothetical protein
MASFDPDSRRRKYDDIRINPVKQGLVTRVRDWPHSSFHHMVKGGVDPEDKIGPRCLGSRRRVWQEGDREAPNAMGTAALHPSYGLNSRMTYILS